MARRDWSATPLQSYAEQVVQLARDPRQIAPAVPRQVGGLGTTDENGRRVLVAAALPWAGGDGEAHPDADVAGDIEGHGGALIPEQHAA